MEFVRGCPHRMLPYGIVVTTMVESIMFSVLTGSSNQESYVVEPGRQWHTLCLVALLQWWIRMYWLQIGLLSKLLPHKWARCHWLIKTSNIWSFVVNCILEQLLLSPMQARSFFGSYWKGPSEDRNGNCRWTGGISTRKGDKRSNHESQNTDAQGMRAPTTTLYVLCGLQEGVRLYLPW